VTIEGEGDADLRTVLEATSGHQGVRVEEVPERVVSTLERTVVSGPEANLELEEDGGGVEEES
jgi:hypothetical protein